ncbi:TonB-dependent siderophore receptor [Methylobacillus caricis]|uniref:TonB-dependent siderophore receptor n=1 Tax=Methylobacillus caricis TaxID=1971611 RepID=UPI001CFFA3D0|nr:TonB-dependent siderophore receptor [Methylobacillus caricis]MCB5186509.1 TonB-dependent siderophore receptor [Methylobacillus caricis]
MHQYSFGRLKLAIHLLLMAGLYQGHHLAYADENSEQESNPASLPVVTVVGSADKTGDNFKSTAQSVSIINEQDIKDIGANRKLDDLLLYEAGVVSQQYGMDNKSNWFRIRGFNANTTLDGTAISNNGFFVWEQEIYGLENVEVLKGANSFNYGATDAGGTINLVSKRPKDIEQSEINFSVGNFSRRTISGDYNGILSQEHGVRYRLVGLYSKGNFPQDHTGMEQYYFAPSISWDISDRTSLTILASAMKKQGTPTSGFMPAYGSLIRTPYGKIGYDTYLGEPNRDYFERRQYSLGYEFSHDFGEHLKFTQNYRYGKMDHDFLTTFAFDSDSDRLGSRGYSLLDGDSTVHSVDNRLSKTSVFGNFENTLMVGLDYKRSKADAQHNGFGGASQIDLFNPVYGTPFSVVSNPYEIRLKQEGIYAFNKLNWNDIVLFSIGIRRDNYDTSSLTGASQTYNADKGDKNTHNISLMVNTPIGLSPYVSHSTSFNPQVGADGNGRPYQPLSGKQLEIGFKYEPTWMKGSFNLAFFDLKEDNALVQDSLTFVQAQIGERKNRGIELQSDWRINDNLNAKLSLTHNNAEQDYDRTGDLIRSGRAQLIPDHQAAVKLNYKHTQGTVLNGLRLSLGVRYNGSTEDKANHPGYTVPSYTLVDATAIYPIAKNWSLQVNATNLLNKEYLSVCEGTCFYGTSRTVDAQLSYHW